MNLTHLKMLDCLLDEVFLGKWPFGKEQLHDKDVIASLFAYFVPFDPRFPIKRCAKGYLVYEGRTAEDAIAHFLGLEVTPKYGKASASALKFIYKEFKDLTHAREWLRWQCQKGDGYTHSRDDLWKGYPREFPRIED